jgi:hypothetical protein
MRAFLEQEELKRQAEAMTARKQSLADPVVVEAFRGASPQRPPSRLNVTPSSAGDPSFGSTIPAVTRFQQQFKANEQRNVDQAKELLGQGRTLFGRGQAAARNLLPTEQVDEFGQSNIPFFQNPRFSPQTGRSGKPSQMYGVPQRARGLGTGSEPYKPAGPRGGQLTGPMAPNPLMPARQTAMPEDEDEFMSWDDQMFLLSLMEGMQGGKPPTPYGTAVGGGNKAWATLPFGRMS